MYGDWMRSKILKVYPKWFAIYDMPEYRVRAIYNSMRERGKFKKNKKKKDEYYQMTIFDYMN